MQCPSCGNPVLPGDAFCATCGADVRGLTAQVAPTQQMQAATAPPPPPPGVAPTQQMPVVSSPPPPAPVAAQPRAAKKGASSAAAVGAVLAIMVGLLVVSGVAAVIARNMWVAKGAAKVAAETNTSKPAAPPSEAAPNPEIQPVSPDAEAATPGDSDIVTDAEAREIVGKFITLRIKGDIEGSKALCSNNMLTGENGNFVDDVYWKPDSFEITKTTPDLMFIHVTTMGDWPSGREPTIYSVYRSPETGKVVIDGMIDPETAPELVTP